MSVSNGLKVWALSECRKKKWAVLCVQKPVVPFPGALTSPENLFKPFFPEHTF